MSFRDQAAIAGIGYTPFSRNSGVSTLTLAIDAINRTPKLQGIGAHAKEWFSDLQIDCRTYAYEHGIDSPEISGWKWPYRGGRQ